MLFDYAETVGYHFTLLDIGGGFPGTENVALKFEHVRLTAVFQLNFLVCYFFAMHEQQNDIENKTARWWCCKALAFGLGGVSLHSGSQIGRELEHGLLEKSMV